MNKRKYRLFVICCLVLDLLVMLISGYRYLDRKIPERNSDFQRTKKQKMSQ